MGTSFLEEITRLLREYQDGCATNTDRLLEAFRPYLLKVAEREVPAKLRPKAAPSDVVQDTLVAAHQGLIRFQGSTAEELRAWLRTILIRQISNAANRYRRTEKRSIGREIRLDDSFNNPGLRDNLRDHGETPSEELKRREEQEALHAALAQLPEDNQRVILLRHREHVSFAEAARVLGHSEQTTRQLYVRSVKRLCKLARKGNVE